MAEFDVNFNFNKKRVSESVKATVNKIQNQDGDGKISTEAEANQLAILLSGQKTLEDGSELKGNDNVNFIRKLLMDFRSKNVSKEFKNEDIKTALNINDPNEIDNDQDVKRLIEITENKNNNFTQEEVAYAKSLLLCSDYAQTYLERNDLKALVLAQDEEIADLTEQNTKLNNEKTQLTEENVKLHEEHDALIIENAELKRQLLEQLTELENLTKQLESLYKNNKALKAEVKKLKAQVSQLRAELNKPVPSKKIVNESLGNIHSIYDGLPESLGNIHSIYDGLPESSKPNSFASFNQTLLGFEQTLSNLGVNPSLVPFNPMFNVPFNPSLNAPINFNPMHPQIVPPEKR